MSNIFKAPFNYCEEGFEEAKRLKREMMQGISG